MQITPTEALRKLKQNKEKFLTLFEHGTMSIEIYQPEKVDLQTPHQQDEIYVVVAGSGIFLNDGIRSSFSAGDLLFVKAGVEHRFENFTEDFSTWVIFYGKKGGE